MSGATLSPTGAPVEEVVVVVVEEPEAHINHEFGAANTLLLVALLMLAVLSGYFLKERKIGHLPEAGSSMLLGALAGAVIRAVIDDKAELALLQFSPLIFFFVLLPPIIFEAGYTLKKKRFFENLSVISLYAVLGTFISTFAVGFLTYLAALTGLIGVDSSSPLQSLLFGSLISSVDPVATLAILGSAEANCDPMLYSLVFGESVLNDAVAIVLFHVMNAYATENKTFQGSDILVVLLRFVGMTVASVVIGVGCGLLCSFVFRNSNLHKYHAYEIQMLFLFSFGSFSLAELAGMSGVVALFFCAVTLAHYNYYNLSVQTKISSRYVFEGMAKTSETVVFLYMGVSIFISGSAWNVAFLLLGTLFCVLGRGANIFSMSWVANACFRRDPDKISRSMQFFMFFSGLRGAVSYALSQQLSKDTGSAHGIEVIQTTTLGIVILSTFFLGGTTSHVLARLHLKGQGGSGENAHQLREDFANYHEMPSQSPSLAPGEEPLASGTGARGLGGGLGGGLDGSLGGEGGGRRTRMAHARRHAESAWKRFDDNHMKRLFGGKSYQKSRISPEIFNAIRENGEYNAASSGAGASSGVRRPAAGSTSSSTPSDGDADAGDIVIVGGFGSNGGFGNGDATVNGHATTNGHDGRLNGFRRASLGDGGGDSDGDDDIDVVDEIHELELRTATSATSPMPPPPPTSANVAELEIPVVRAAAAAAAGAQVDDEYQPPALN